MADYPPGWERIKTRTCPIGATHPMACWFCPFGHATECHHPHTCSAAECGHYRMARAAEEAIEEGQADGQVQVP